MVARTKKNFERGYYNWKKKYGSILEALPQKKVLVFFSGGKDSSVAMHFISLAAKEFGFDFEAHLGAFPPHRYPETDKSRLRSYWDQRGISITWHELGISDDEIQGSVNPCHECQRARKGLLKKIVLDSGVDLHRLVLVAGFNLWDIVSYSIEYILTGIFSNSQDADPAQRNKRFIETSQRFYPLMRMQDGYMVFRPLIKYNNDHILSLIEEADIPILSIPCRFKEYRPKKILEEYYKKTGMNFDYNRVFEFAKECLNFPDLSFYASIPKEEYLGQVF